MIEGNPDWTFDTETRALYGPHPTSRGLRVPAATGIESGAGLVLARRLNKRRTTMEDWTAEAAREDPLSFGLVDIVVRQVFRSDGTWRGHDVELMGCPVDGLLLADPVLHWEHAHGLTVHDWVEVSV